MIKIEIKLKSKDILKLIQKEFGEETTIEEMEKDYIIIDVDMFAFQKKNSESDAGFHNNSDERKPIKATTVPKELQVLTQEQERAIRMEVAKYGGAGRDYAKSTKMTNERVVEPHSSESRGNVMVDKKHGSIIDNIR